MCVVSDKAWKHGQLNTRAACFESMLRPLLTYITVETSTRTQHLHALCVLTHLQVVGCDQPYISRHLVA